MVGGMKVPLSNFVNAVEVLKKRKQMTLEEFAKFMGYSKFNRHYIISMVIPRGLALVADEQTRKCFKLVHNMLEKRYYVEWVCHE